MLPWKIFLERLPSFSAFCLRSLSKSPQCTDAHEPRHATNVGVVWQRAPAVMIRDANINLAERSYCTSSETCFPTRPTSFTRAVQQELASTSSLSIKLLLRRRTGLHKRPSQRCPDASHQAWHATPSPRGTPSTPASRPMSKVQHSALVVSALYCIHCNRRGRADAESPSPYP